MPEEEQDQKQDFGIPDDSEFRIDGQILKGWPSESDGNRKEATITQAPDQRIKATLISRPKKTKARVQPKVDLTPLLNALAGEIEETMDLLILARGSLADHRTKDPDQRIEVLCRRVSASLLSMQDIGDRIAAAVEE